MEFFFAWLVFACVVGYLASTRGRSGGGFFALSLLLSPLLGLIILLVIPNLAQAEALGAFKAREEAQKEEARKREHERHLESLKALAANRPQPEVTVSINSSIADELVKLAELRDRGILTEDEFISQKKALLKHSRGESQ